MKISNKTAWIIFVSVILIFFLIEIKGLNHYDPGDEHIYFHRAELLADGIIPYKDFFFAHPPMQLFIAAPLIKIFGFNLILLKLIPLTATIISALFLFLLMRKYSNAKAILAVILFLFAYNVMLEATYFLGINLTTMFVIISIYYLFEKKYLAAGLFSGLAGITGLYALIPVAVIFVFLGFSFFKNKKPFLYFLAGFSIIFVLVNLIFILLYGNNYLTPVYKYHLLKPKTVSSTINIFYDIIKNNIILFFSTFLFICQKPLIKDWWRVAYRKTTQWFLSMLRNFPHPKKSLVFSHQLQTGGKFLTFAKNKKRFSLIITISLVYLLFLIKLTKIFNFYFILLFPFLAILGSSALVDLYKKFKIKKNLKLVIASIFSIIILINIILSSNHLIKFDFIDFESLEEISEFVKQNSKPDELVFGDDSSIHLISKASQRDIAIDNIDTNDMIFKSNIISLKDTINNLKKENIKFIIIRPLYGIGALEEFSNYLNKECTLAKWFKDYYYGDFLIYDCKTKPKE